MSSLLEHWWLCPDCGNLIPTGISHAHCSARETDETGEQS